MRAQSSLPVLGVALVLLVVTMLFALSVADGQLAAADTETIERQTAAGIAERLVAADSSVTARANVVRPGALSNLGPGDLGTALGLRPDDGASVFLDGDEIVTAGQIDGGSTVERIVLVETRGQESIRPQFTRSPSVTLPRRTPNVTLDVAPNGSTTIQTVRANGAVVLHDPGGLSGQYTVDVPRYETATLTFGGTGSLSSGDVEIEFWPPTTRKARLRVTVQRWGDPDG